ncbi:hypothetical protein AVEN_56927-2-1, partial [Araneus ventricosus]
TRCAFAHAKLVELQDRRHRPPWSPTRESSHRTLNISSLGAYLGASQNVYAESHPREFVDGLSVTLPSVFYPEEEDPVKQLYNDLNFKVVTAEQLKGRAILTVTTDLSIDRNNFVLNLIPGREEVYANIDCILNILDCSEPFGGNVVYLGGDFRQVLPVAPRGLRSVTASGSLIKHPLWLKFNVLYITKIFKLWNQKKEFSKCLLEFGDGLSVKLPSVCYPKEEDPVEQLYNDMNFKYSQQTSEKEELY